MVQEWRKVSTFSVYAMVTYFIWYPFLIVCTSLYIIVFELFISVIHMKQSFSITYINAILYFVESPMFISKLGFCLLCWANDLHRNSPVQGEFKKTIYTQVFHKTLKKKKHWKFQWTLNLQTICAFKGTFTKISCAYFNWRLLFSAGPVL